MLDRRKVAVLVAALLLSAGIGLAACARTPTTTGGTAVKGPIRVGSKMDGEGSLLGQMIIAVLQDRGFTVEDRTRTGATEVVRKALLTGLIDVYPEYTANGVVTFLTDQNIDPAVLRDANMTYSTVSRVDLAVNGVVWLEPAPANNTWAVAVPKSFADANGVRTMDDWAAYVNSGKPVKIVGSQEFFTSEAAMPAFEKAYGFELRPDQIVALGTGDTAVTEKAAASGTDGANAAMAYGTDGTIAALDLVVLADPRAAQPVYQPCPTLLKKTSDKYPEIAEALDPVFRRLTLETLQSLNGQVSVDGKDPETVARDWLTSQGLIE